MPRDWIPYEAGPLCPHCKATTVVVRGVDMPFVARCDRCKSAKTIFCYPLPDECPDDFVANTESQYSIRVAGRRGVPIPPPEPPSDDQSISTDDLLRMYRVATKNADLAIADESARLLKIRGIDPTVSGEAKGSE